MIVRLELPPGSVLHEEQLRQRLGIGRTPIREALQRLERDQFVIVMPRRGMLVSPIDVAELGVLHETRALLEPYAARLACSRGLPHHWDEMARLLAAANRDVEPEALLDVDRECHELIWAAADNRFLTATLDMLYAQSDRLWHMYLADVADMSHAVSEHVGILDALRAGDATRSAELIEAHVRAFDDQVRDAVRLRLDRPIATA
jgi:DNA-binding GntR family transcriptional regulator